ncbi:dTMP kinase [Cohnella rhizosphaerae]|uniref:Thymidylate kinase n=1 Tax=Cohnella rhizosphaerae TaxID=1457232 RepID=A0A9X4KQD3_9BACL|nr:dTMP kinase [Cohnella rhizosphaerae]MDG0808895.1 dTMP kinase [Cohnella rhizosphaerae]
MKRGHFITIEGNEGAGKSTIALMMLDYMRDKGLTVVATREPGGIAIAEQIRAIVLDNGNTAMDGRTEALLYAAARRQHFVEKIVPTLEQGKTILCDRFVDSSLAYQGFARGLGIDEVMSINAFAIEGVFPDLTIYLDVDPQVGIERIHAHGEREINRLDLESSAFHQRVREGYQEALARYPDRIVRIDANPDIGDVFAAVAGVLDRFLDRSE